ncbi:MAG: hypothetical protein IJF90_05205 [Synergistaceae bacterium]|nr:hypothetical protein [Synergistaceae bacterium]
MEGMKKMGMPKFRKFRVSWPTGYIEVYPKFFGKVKLSNINAFLRLAKRYSTEKERNELLMILREGVDALYGLKSYSQATYYMILQIERCIEKIKKQTWKGECV